MSGMMALAMGLPFNIGSRIRSAFSPSSLFASGEQGIWLDPSDFSTMFQDSGGTTPVTAVDQPVGLILDKSGRGNHASQTTTTKRPILKIDGNGKYYLKFDGIDDAMATGSINFTATDKMTVVTGVRKLSDVIGMLCELSTSASTNTGTFYLVSGTDAGFKYSTTARGSFVLNINLITGDITPAPDTAVIILTHNIAGDLTTFRRNKVTAPNATGEKGTGNFGNYPLYIGSRAGTSLPFNGNLYSMIVRGAQSSEAQILSAETYCNQKTGAF